MAKGKQLIVLSASAISTLKACPTKYRNAYVLGIRRSEDPESRRMGSSWHEGQEIMYKKQGDSCCTDPHCPRCLGTNNIDDPLDAMTRAMNRRYETLFPGLSKETKETERAVILYALFAYKYFYDEQPIQTITTELPFRIPLIDPRTRKAVPDVVIDGKLDKLIEFEGQPAVMEHKSTSDDLDPASDYWGHLRLDTQTMTYAYAAQRLQADGLLMPDGILASDPPIGTILYDVWKKPGIRPKKLSQADTAQFIETGKYYDREFEIDSMELEGSQVVHVDGQDAEIEQLKKGFAIRETPDMYGCRLFNEINENPSRYFARRTIVRTSVEIERFEWELFSLYQTVASHIEHDAWFHNEFECNSYGKCDYCQFCFTGQELDPNNPPAGFINIFDKEKK